MTIEMKGFLQIRKTEALTERGVNVSRRRGKDDDEAERETNNGGRNGACTGGKKAAFSKNEQRDGF